MGKSGSQTVSRRALFSGRHGAPLRPPWTTQTSIQNACTGCGDCIAACPEAILFSGPANTPIVSFESGECTFCEACVQACKEPVFDIASQPWAIRADIADNCVMNIGISCRLCTDICEVEALVFDLSQRPVGKVSVNRNLCNGCGACVAACTFSAISIMEPLGD
ncbi:ferredoxin-type protein NapF [Parasedimentitalea marina]|uniref:Ferredoxin-type protein NapF n=1 Tax=Parasedimentitalea marina TaxID=2483033 RepID=A0A3T0N0A2_9RHOB|nr:ferredoxin-type protein NapF [Parasedimentitalea marina]